MIILHSSYFTNFPENWYIGVFEDACSLYQHQKSWRRRFHAKVDRFIGVRNILHHSLDFTVLNLSIADDD